ncbi:MAG: cell wall hydrolase [bacterium]|jgi:N-acetylmuramoyl-L-alanine amidase
MKQKRWLKMVVILLAIVAMAVGVGIKKYPGWLEGPTASAAGALSPQMGYPTYDDVWLLARVISGEAHNEPYVGQVAVGAVILNRVRSPEFPPTVSGVVYDIDAFESVSNGIMWALPPTDEHIAAAQVALDGWDPTYGSLYFWNPSKDVSPWIWSRNIITTIGRHVFGI